MSLANLLFAIAVVAAAWHVTASLLIYNDLRARGRNPSFLLLRFYIPAYAGEYRKLTIAESGRTGPLFYHWVISINTALVATIAAVLALRAG